MTAQDYINKGYRLSLHTAQAEIDAKEELAFKSYILPILPTAEKESEEVKDALMALAFLLLLQANIFSTRSGAKIKNAPQSINPTEWQILNENTVIAHRCLEELKTLPNAEKKPKIYDVAHIYFRTQYFNL
jgi:hypothetical protein